MQAPAQPFNVLLLGDAGVGKTTFALYQYSQSNLDSEHPTTHDANCYPYHLETNKGPVDFTLRDTAGATGSLDLEKEWETGIHAVIIMFDVKSRASYESVPAWYDRIPEQLRNTIPITLCGNKVDLPYSRLGPETIRFHREKGLRYSDISAKKGYSIHRVLVKIAQRLLNDDSLEDLARFLQLQRMEANNDNNVAADGAQGGTRDIGPLENATPSEELLKLLATPPPADDIKARLEHMIAVLKLTPNIEVTSARISPPATKEEIEQARADANGRLPVGVEEFYSQVGSFELEWKFDQSKKENSDEFVGTGNIDILPICRIFGDNWRGIIWFPLPPGIEGMGIDDEWRYEHRKVLPFDFFKPEACACFIREEGRVPDDCIAYHYCGEDLYQTRYTFPEYIDRLLQSYGYFYWVQTLCPGCESSSEVEDFKKNMSKIFAAHDGSLFCPREE